MIQEKFKYILTRIGTKCSRDTIYLLDATINYLEVGRWMTERNFACPRRFGDRFEMFEWVGGEVGDQQVLYLEFGVSKGESMERWSNILRHPQATLHGFDSFQGLPEDWNSRRLKGAFSAGRQIPKIADSRVTFFPGLFQDTLPRYCPPPHEVLIISIDADLYSSTIFVLNHLKDWIRPGTYLYFDEFCDRDHELRAFDEFLAANQMQFDLLAANKTMLNVLFRRRA